MKIEDIAAVFKRDGFSPSEINSMFSKLLDVAKEHKDLLEDLSDLGVTHDYYGYSLDDLESKPILS